MTGFSRRLARVAFCLSLISAFVLAADSKPSDETLALLSRIFAKKEFKAKTFGPARWLEGGKAYRTAESSRETPDGKDVFRYDSATGALSFDVDGVGGAAQVQFALLSSAPIIGASDFTVF